MARAMASVRGRALARTRDRPRLRARAMVSSRARTWECVYVLSAQTVFAGGPNLT